MKVKGQQRKRRQRDKLNDLNEKFYQVCLLGGYLVGVGSITFVLVGLHYPLWFTVPLAIVGGIPIGIPIGGIPGLLLSAFFYWLTDLLYPEPKSKSRKALGRTT